MGLSDMTAWLRDRFGSEVAGSPGVARLAYPLELRPRLKIRQQVYDVIHASPTELNFTCRTWTSQCDVAVGEWITGKLEWLSGKTVKVNGITRWDEGGLFAIQLLHALDRKDLDRDRRLVIKRQSRLN